jgi:hypothetical protein
LIHTTHEFLIVAIPRLLAASYIMAIVLALIIKLTFRPGRSHLAYKPRGRGAGPPLR